MRVITGKYRGKKLDYPTKGQFRPTQDKVKESIFNILSMALEGILKEAA